MNFLARLKSMWSKHDERLAERGVEAQSAGGDDLELTPGLDRTIGQRAEKREHTDEHEQPE